VQFFPGPRVMLNLNQSNENSSTAAHESQLINRSVNNQTMCLQFYYMIYSPVPQTLKLYQMVKFDDYQPRIIWQVTRNESSMIWQYSEVSVIGLSDFKVFLHSKNAPIE